MAEMARAYDLAARAVRRRLAEQRPDQLATLDEVRKGDLAVFTGSYDSVKEVLSRLGLPFTTNPRKLQAAVVFTDCPGSGHPALVQNIEPHVREGAWLVSSDWSLHHVVEAAFPGMVRWDRKKQTADEVVPVEAYLDSSWSEVVVPGADPQWWLEAGSYPITIVDTERVRVEAVSHELLVKHGSGVVAVRFDWGAGHVFHVISHFWLKRSRAPGQRYQGPCTDFLRGGMRLSEEGIAQVLAEARLEPEDLNFACIQSAATSTELIAQLCIQAKRARALAA
jgi:hypothetical protein